MNFSINIIQKFFPDKRITNRCNWLINAMISKPACSLTALAESSADAKSIYRFLESKRFDFSNILNGYIHSVKKLISNMYKLRPEKSILIIQDSSDIDFSNLKMSELELGYIQDNIPRNKIKSFGKIDINKVKQFINKGVMIHSALATTLDGEPIGLVHQKVWTRDFENYGKRYNIHQKPIEEKESYKWLETFKQVVKLKLKKNLIFVGDRESDLNDFYSLEFKENNADFVIRSKSNRVVMIGDKKQKLVELLREQKQIKINFTLPRTHEANEKVIELSITSSHVTFAGSKVFKESKEARSLKGILPHSKVEYMKDIKLNAVLVENQAENIKWLLLTSLKIDQFNDVLRIIDIYKHRWLIERYHYILKSGFEVEELQLKTKDKITKAIVLLSISAIQILRMTILSRTQGDTPCTIIFEEDEWKAIHMAITKTQPPKEVPSLNSVVVNLARLGGFLARKGDGQPGAKVLWRGMVALNHIKKIYPLFVGKG